MCDTDRMVNIKANDTFPPHILPYCHGCSLLFSDYILLYTMAVGYCCFGRKNVCNSKTI